MALIRWATRRPDGVVVLRLLTAVALVGGALGTSGASAVVVVATAAGALVAESAVELAWRPTAAEEPSRIVLPHDLQRSRGPRRQ